MPASPQKQARSGEENLQAAPADAVQKRPVLRVPHQVTVAELAALLGVKTFVVVADLLSRRELLYAHQSMSESIVRKVCRGRSFDVEFVPA